MPRALALITLTALTTLGCGGLSTGEAALDRTLVWHDREGQPGEVVPASTAPYTTISFEPGEQAIVAAVGGRRRGFSRVNLVTGAHEAVNTPSPWTSHSPASLPTHLSRQWMLFDAPGDDGVIRIQVAPREDGGTSRPYLETPTANSGGRLSFEERWVAYISLESGRPELYVSTFPEADARWLISLPDGAAHPVWRADSRELYYWAPGGRLMVTALLRGDRLIPCRA